MSKERLLTFLVITLTVLNLVLLGLFLFQKPPGMGRGGIDMGNDKKNIRIASEHLGFDEQQKEVYIESRKRHIAQMDTLPKALAKASREYYQLGTSDQELEERERLLLEIEALNKKIYQANVDHFDDLRKICRPDQIPKLQRFINQILNNLNRQGPRKRPRRKRN